MRKVTLLETPTFHPYVCVQCGVGAGPLRQWFVDLGFDVDEHTRGGQKANVYLCNECLPGFLDELLRIMSEQNNKLMDNSLLKEEPTYGIVSGIVGGSELSSVRFGSSESEVSGTRTDSGNLQVLDPQENVPDTGHRSSADTSVEPVDAPKSDDSGTESEIKSTVTPTFRMGRRTN